MENETSHVKFILQKEVRVFIPLGNNTYKVDLISGKEWKNLDAESEDLRININAKRSDAGLIYEIKGYVRLKSTEPNLDLLRISQSIIIQYTATDGVSRVIGTDDYPLQITLSPLNESTDYILNFEGKQEFEPPVIM